MRTTRYTNASRFVLPEGVDEDLPEMPRATIAMHSSGICTIGAAMQNDARYVAVSQSAVDVRIFSSKDDLNDNFKGILFSDEQDLFCSYSRFFLCLLDCFNMTIIDC